MFLSAQVSQLRRAVNDAYDAGVIMVCAAGNHVNSAVGPARLHRTLTIAGVTQADVPWCGSSFGPEADLSAPAADIRRASVRKRTQFSYGGGDGTSYATAMTAGAAALWLAHHAQQLPNADAQPWHRVEAFRDVATRTARSTSAWQPGAFGSGILNIEALLKAPLPTASNLVQQPAA